MSGVNRNVMADVNKGGSSMEEYKKATTPEAIRAEKGTDAEDAGE